MKKIILLLCFILMPTVQAGEETGTVRFDHSSYYADSTSAGMAFFYLDGGTRVSVPGCATNYSGQRWVIDNDWPAAHIQHSVLLTALTTGKEVKIVGSGDCGVNSGDETAMDIHIVD